ncbi:hypothetical protein [Micromonospora robiginosa]|uniref:Uncharacterized protein n=1 Tax=Micromonospora robiginosa TaxID=2749844 RepID=A0A7L6B073_9ACTN|nr:hypothetical protein [Micromonospora ferruginea]QLQ35362.1 hypothetical protein H1D33_18395 [Micromonospora ferruginea]
MTQRLQATLLELAPRSGGPATVEPRIHFEEVQQSLHSANRCPYTCGPCTDRYSDRCVATGRTV